MRLFEAIVDANHRAVAGDTNAGVRVADHQNELPIIALTCVDPRLNAFFPNVIGVPADQFIWLRNAGNVITSSHSSTMRSLALSCAIKGGKEIAIIGHTDCQVCKTTTMELLDRLKALGIERHLLPENLSEYFGMFGSERQNVIKACDFVRRSPLIGASVPVHGFLVDIETGKLEWIVNGYQTFATTAEKWNDVVKSAGETVDKLRALGDFQIGEMKFPETKIGEVVTNAGEWLSKHVHELEIQRPAEPNPSAGPQPPKAPALPKPVAKVVEEVADYAEMHWPKAVPPKLPANPIRPRMVIRGKSGRR